jgi:hypothetical protein
VGYIDASNARDLVTMLQSLQLFPDAPAIHDALLIEQGMRWGDRSPAFTCARDKGLGREDSQGLSGRGRADYVLLAQDER